MSGQDPVDTWIMGRGIWAGHLDRCSTYY
jgi:hypothetical protein